MKERKLAIFDIDGTIFRSSLLIELVSGLTNEGIFPKSVYKEIEKDYFAWLDRKGSYDNYINQVLKIFLANIKGCKEEDLEKVVKKVVFSQRDHIYRYTRKLIRELKDKGYFLLAISGSPIPIVSEFSLYNKFDSFYGSQYETKRGIFTGKITQAPVQKGKKLIIKKFLNSSKIKFDLTKSIAIGDTASDIPILEMVGRPIAFNPNLGLVKHARKKGWKIVVERKDVVYNIFSFKLEKYEV